MPLRYEEMISLGSIAERESASINETRKKPRVTVPGELENREGFDPEFLQDLRTDLPKRVRAREHDEAPRVGGGSPVLDYEHFSLVMSKSRRLAIFTACNIDGKKSKKIPRDTDTWFHDGRISLEHQVGEELYAGNRLDRGHLVRREDPVWGTSAAIANDDTFHFTNCSPQYDSFNQQIWLGLENYLLLNARAHDLQVSVFTGPVFRDGDMAYRGIKIPREYWKVVALVTEDGRPSVTAYKVSQSNLLDEGLEFVFGRYKTFQVSMRHVESLASLDFGALKDHDGFSTAEAVPGHAEIVNELTDWRQILI